MYPTICSQESNVWRSCLYRHAKMEEADPGTVLLDARNVYETRVGVFEAQKTTTVPAACTNNYPDPVRAPSSGPSTLVSMSIYFQCHFLNFEGDNFRRFSREFCSISTWAIGDLMFQLTCQFHIKRKKKI